MKRAFAAVILLAALGVLFKLALKAPIAADDRRDVSTTASAIDPEAALRSKYRGSKDRDLVARLLARYRQTAVAIERTDGVRGLTLLDKLDLEAVFLYEKHPDDFRRLRDTLTDDAAAEVLLHWRDYFGLKRGDDLDRGRLIAEIGRLSPTQRKVAAKHPSALPLLLAEPSGVAELIERWSGDPKDLNDLLVVLTFISLEHGSADLRSALGVIDEYGVRALEAFRLQGLDGFALVALYGPVLDALAGALPTDQALVLLRVNGDDVDAYLHTHRPETLAGHLRHASSSGLVESVGGSPHALRLLIEHGVLGEAALRQGGPDAADVVYEDFADPTLRNQAVEALTAHGPMALAVLDKYAADPEFRAILRLHGAAVVPPVARADAAPETLGRLGGMARWTYRERLAYSVMALSNESGQATIKAIRADGLARVAALNDPDVSFAQFLPLYDLLHLGNVLRHGYAPTNGEMTWAALDACFVVADALSLAAVQPEGVAASEAARAEVKAATREAAKAIGRSAVEDGVTSSSRAAARAAAEATADRVSRWWAVRAAGGAYKVLLRMPQALPRLPLSELSSLSRPLCSKAGFRLSSWGPVRLWKDGREFILRIPPERGLKYLGVQAAGAGVGAVGFRKMEEHLASKRP